MRFPIEALCRCGGKIPFTTYGDGDWPSQTCSECGAVIYQSDPLSVSVVAERLLYRSSAELNGGDYSSSIIIATMAVESFLTRLFFKVKGMDNDAKTFAWPTEAQEKAWEAEYPR